MCKTSRRAGRCVAVDEAVEGRRRALATMQQMWKAVHLPKKGKGQEWKVRPGLGGAAEVIAGARAAMAGEAGDTAREERQWTSWRLLLAGALPRPGDELEDADRRAAATAIVAGVRSLQKEAAGWVAGWEEAGRKEAARRREEDERAGWGGDVERGERTGRGETWTSVGGA